VNERLKRIHVLKRFISIAAVFLILLPATGFCGAWTMPKGKMYVKVSANTYKSDERFDLGGNEEDYDNNGFFRDRNIGIYAEYGLVDGLSLIGSTQYKFLEQENDLEKKKYNGISDIDLAVKARLLNNSIGVFSVQGLVKVPEAYDTDATIPPGNGEYDFEVRLMYGRSLYPMFPGYVNVEGAYRFRDGVASDELRFLGEFGVDFMKAGYVRIKAESVASMGDMDMSTDTGNPNVAYDYDQFKMSATLGFKLTERWGVECETIRELSGKNVSKGNTYSASLYCIY
jgi:hypothetical protein